MRIQLLKLAAVSAFFSLCSPCAIFSYESKPCIVLSQPKGGTNLILKLLEMLTEKHRGPLFGEYVPAEVDQALQSRLIPSFHLFGPSFNYKYFQKHHLQAAIFVIIRDPRDSLVSYAHWISPNANEPMQTKLARAFKEPAYAEMIRHLPLFLNHPRFFIVKFEDLVGPQGGGSLKTQKKTIVAIAKQIGLEFPNETIEEFARNLFGNKEETPVSFTFREGKIGSWKENFTEENKRLFKKKYNDVLIQLGYVKNSKW